MNRHDVLERILEIGIVPVVRADSPDKAIEICRQISAGGIPVIELTMTVPSAIEVIAELKHTLKNALIGGGTVLDEQTANRCIDAGAEFIVSPGPLPFVDRNILAIPGALTPTEIIQAWHSGASLIKIFPCGNVGGPAYIKALKAALPQIRMIPTGGVNLANAKDFFQAGASAIGVGAELTSAPSITETARQFASILTGPRPLEPGS